jgi:hypothetical protein
VAELSPFEVGAEALRTLLGNELGPWQVRSHRWGLKLWFGDELQAPREHYEAQTVSRRHVPTASSFAIEVGFHAEHPDDALNDAVLEQLRAGGSRWRRSIGGAVEEGAFLGRQGWRRISETWLDPDLRDPELPLAMACRVVDYAAALEPARRAAARSTTGGLRGGGGRAGAPGAAGA